MYIFTYYISLRTWFQILGDDGVFSETTGIVGCTPLPYVNYPEGCGGEGGVVSLALTQPYCLFAMFKLSILILGRYVLKLDFPPHT